MTIDFHDDVWLAGGIRSPFGRFRGALAGTDVVELGRQVIEAVVSATQWVVDGFDEFYLGMGMIEGGRMVPARSLALAAGIPQHVPSLTVDRACCSGMTVTGLGARAVQAGASAVLAMGLESMSRTPRLLHGSRGDSPVGALAVEDLLLLQSPITQTPIARYVGEVALAEGVDREAQDLWAYRSQMKYQEAANRRYFDGEIAPIRTAGGVFEVDEHPRPETTVEVLSSLPTVRESPTVTAGNAPGLNDGGCALVLASRAEIEMRQLPATVAVRAYLQTAESPTSSAYLPGAAIATLLGAFELTPSDLDVIEINEAYAATPLVSIRRLAGGDSGLETELLSRTNVNGGAVAVGHPVGASGARIVLTAARHLQAIGGRWAVAAICGGFGQTDAILLEARGE